MYYPGKANRNIKGGNGHLEGRVNYLVEHLGIAEEKNLVQGGDCRCEKETDPDYIQQILTLFFNFIIPRLIQLNC